MNKGIIKSKSYKYIGIVLLCCLLLYSLPLHAQLVPVISTNPTTESLTTESPTTISVSLKPQSPLLALPSEQVMVKLTNTSAAKIKIEITNLVRDDAEMAALHNWLVEKKFQPMDGSNNFYKLAGTFTADIKQISNFKSKSKDEQESLKNSRLTYTLYIQDYTNPLSTDVAAIGQIVLKATTRTSNRYLVYSFCLISPNGDYENPEEYNIDESECTVVRAHSLFTCFWTKVRISCLNPCLLSIAPCITACGPSSWTWTCLLSCMAPKCGGLSGCMARAFACCACNCKHWCKWAVGCCHQ